VNTPISDIWWWLSTTRKIELTAIQSVTLGLGIHFFMTIKTSIHTFINLEPQLPGIYENILEATFGTIEVK
jgi:hypothetical protein